MGYLQYWAKTPEGYGDFFAYGEVKSKSSFTSENFTGYGAYVFANPYSHTTFAEEDAFFSETKDASKRLNKTRDAARQVMGGANGDSPQ